MLSEIERAAAYRDRANRLRAIAEGPAEKMREALFVVAEDYDGMATAIDKRRRSHAPNSN